MVTFNYFSFFLRVERGDLLYLKILVITLSLDHQAFMGLSPHR